MRNPLIALVVTMLTLASCNKEANSSAPNSGTVPEPDQLKSAEVKQLIAAVQKRNAYVETDKKNSARPVLRIQFRRPGIKDADLEQLRPLLQASTLPVVLNLGEDITGAGLKHLAGITTLNGLSLSNDKITNDDLAHLEKLTNLRKVSIYSKQVTDAGYAHLAGLTQLEELHAGGIGQEIGDVCLSHMKSMTKLKELSIGGQQLTDAGMAHVKNFSELRELKIQGPKLSGAGLANLAALKNLEKLEFYACSGINGNGLAGLEKLIGLRELQIYGCGIIEPTATAHLSGLSNLKKLRLDNVKDESLKGIKGLTNLEELDLNYTWITDAAMQHLTGLIGLRSVNLMKTKITDAGMKYLSGLTNLEKLNLCDDKISDDGLKALTTLTKLKELFLEDCKIAGPGLKHLSGLTSLQDLRLNANPITDESLVHLQNLKGLKYLFLTGTKVTDEGVMALKKALPKTSLHDYSGQEVALEKKPTPRPKVTVEDISKSAPAFSLSADKFSEEYKENRNAAEQKYKGKVVELSGVVKSMGRNISDEAYISLEAGKDLLGVMCFTADAEPWAKVAPSQKVKLKGKWPEFSVGAALIYCVFLETGTYQATVLAAEQLAKEYGADPEAMTKKYQDKYLVVSGEVVDRDFNSAGAASIGLKGDGKVRVKCHFPAFESKQTRSMKVGQKVKAIGQYIFNSDKDEVGLHLCLPIKQR